MDDNLKLSVLRKQTHKHREETAVVKSKDGGGMDWESGISGCKLLGKQQGY